jgi:CRP-like cAMP-binding protein
LKAEKNPSFQADALSHKLGAFLDVGSQEKTMLELLQGPQSFIGAGKEVVYEGQNNHAAYVLRKGWVCSYKRLRDGGRQIVDIQIPGDFLGLSSLLLRTSDQGFISLTEIELAKINTNRLQEVLQTTPRLAAALLWAVSRDQAIVVEHLVNIGRRDTMARTAHFLLELHARLSLVGLGTVDGYHCPLPQSVLADALGVTAIHLNRVLRQLREDNLVIFRDSAITFLDRERLARFAGFDLTYLDHKASLTD